MIGIETSLFLVTIQDSRQSPTIPVYLSIIRGKLIGVFAKEMDYLMGSLRDDSAT